MTSVHEMDCLGGRNCSFVWSFWCSELCSVDQMAAVQRGSVLDVRGPEWFCQPFCSLWISTVLGEWWGLNQWFAQQSGLPSVVFWGQIWKLSWTRQLLTCRGRIQWWQSRTVSAASVAGCTSSADIWRQIYNSATISAYFFLLMSDLKSFYIIFNKILKCNVVWPSRKSKCILINK